MNKQSQQLVAFCREHRRGAPPSGNILDKATLVEVLGLLLDSALTEPEGTPERVVQTPNGIVTVPAKPPPPWRPEVEREIARALATLVGYVEDL